MAFVILAMFLMNGLIGCVKKETALKNPKYEIASFYKSQKYEIKANITHILPLNLNEVENSNILNLFNLNEKQKDFLEKNGFVLIKGDMNNISKVYKWIRGNGMPIFITTDTFLHLYHIHFNEILKEIEENQFYYQLFNLTAAMLNKSKEDYAHYNGILKEAARRNVAYFSVALYLLGKEDIPSYVENEVKSEVEKIEKHEGIAENSIFHYKEDYSQYVPRGHYNTEKLKRYFKAMMWYGRIAFFLKKGIVSKEDAKIATIEAIMISWNLNHVKVDGVKAIKIWDKIYAVTSFFVGIADDLTPYEYIKVIESLPSFEISILKNDEKLDEIRKKIESMVNQKIYGGSGFLIAKNKKEWEEKFNETMGMRFMGQRYTPDSFIFQQLVSPMVGMYVGKDAPFTMCMTEGGAARCFPRGLDVFAVLGSDDALSILKREGDTEYAGENTSYYKQLEFLRNEFGNMSVEEWNRNLYFSWLYTLKSLIELKGEYPDFMNGGWKYKELQTALASWVELRHDTILYAKQSYTAYLSAIPSKSMGYVEPIPEFYSRLYSLINMTINGLKSLGAVNEKEEEQLTHLKNLVYSALEISIDEIDGKSLDKYGRFFTTFVDEVDKLSKFNEDAIKTTLVADVHTDLNTNMCLEEGVGNIDFAIISFYNEGKVYLAVGPILSYYEFKQPINERLNDKEWEELAKKAEMDEWQKEIYPK